jgi:serine/threonine protein kinase
MNADAADTGDVALPRGSRVQEFEVEALIGKGGFSIVYRARDTLLGRVIALKEYLPATLARRGIGQGIAPLADRHSQTFQLGLRSFVNEAQLLASFDHPSLVKVYRFWEENGTAYMAMPLYQGPTLAEWLQARHAPPSEAWLRELLAPLLDALELIHASRCYHRDIAPDNILLLDRAAAATDSTRPQDEAPHPVLLDFGAARRVIGDATQALTVILKPGYAPIEQYSGTAQMRQGPWTDIYALCALLYRALTGHTPAPSVGRSIHDELVPAVTAAHGRCSEAFLRAIDVGMAVRPQERPQSVRELRALFDAATPITVVMAPPARAGAGALPAPPEEPLPTLARPPAPRAPPPSPRREPAKTTRMPPTGDTTLVPMAQPRSRRATWIAISIAAVVFIGAGVWYSLQRGRATALPTPPLAQLPPPAQTAAAPATDAPPPQPASPALAVPAQPFSVLGALGDIVQGADPEIRVDARAEKSTLAIGRDRLRLRVRASHAGHVYLFTGGTEKSHFYLLFPNRLDRNNRIDPGQELVLPRPSWEVTAGGPPGVNHIVVMVSRSPRDFSGTGIKAVGSDIPEFDLEEAATRWAGRTGAASPFVGAAACRGDRGADCAQGYGARMIEVEEVAR